MKSGLKKLAAKFAALYMVIKDALAVLFGIEDGDSIEDGAGKVAETVAKGSAYWVADYAATALSPLTVGFCKWLGWTELETIIVVWIEDMAIAYGFVLFSRHVVEDFTVTEALRASIEVIWRKSKVVGGLLAAGLLFRFSIWDGPERVAIFFHKELPKMYQELLVIAGFSVIQAIFWTKLYSLGIDGLVRMWKLLF